MKQLISSFLFLSFIMLSMKGYSESSTSGFLLFGKNKTEGTAMCTQQGICKLQQMEDSSFIPITLTATLVDQATNTYRISFSFSYGILLNKEPDQEPYFNSGSPYPVSDKFVIPSWLLTAWGFEASINRNITILAPFDLGTPITGADGRTTMTFSKTVVIKPKA